MSSIEEATAKYQQMITEATVEYERKLQEASKYYYAELEKLHSNVQKQVSSLIESLSSFSITQGN